MHSMMPFFGGGSGDFPEIPTGGAVGEAFPDFSGKNPPPPSMPSGGSSGDAQGSDSGVNQWGEKPFLSDDDSAGGSSWGESLGEWFNDN
jgi:hypothetical protein